jgi:hypothetical protein
MVKKQIIFSDTRICSQTMTPIEIFTRHPAAVGESYGEHFQAATGFGLRMLAGAVACLVHAVFPFLFVRTGSGIIRELHDRMVVNRRPQATDPGVVAALEQGQR